MTAIISAPPPVAVPQPPADPRADTVVLDGISWETYERPRDELDDAGRHVRLVYDDGRLVVMAPGLNYDRKRKLIGRMVWMLTFELDIPIASCGSTTWKHEGLRKGAEPDEGYYIQQGAQMGGRMSVDLTRDPPPDLVLEVEVSLSPVDKFPVYAALGVPEIWRHDGRTIRCLHLREGAYHLAEASLAFPFLRPAELQRFLDMLPAHDENTMLRAFLDWVRALHPSKRGS